MNVNSYNQNDEISEVGSLDDAFYQNDLSFQKKEDPSQFKHLHVPLIEIHQVGSSAKEDSYLSYNSSHLEINHSAHKDEIINKDCSDKGNIL